MVVHGPYPIGETRVAREVAVPICFEHEILCYHRLDMLVNDTIVIEVKASATLHPVSERQLLHYLRATNLEVGLLLHFGPEAAFRRVFNSNRFDP